MLICSVCAIYIYLRETFTICIMHRSLLAVWALWWLHNAILQCVTVHRVPKFTSCHNAIMVVTGRGHCSILLYSYGLFFLVLFCLDANRARLEKLRNHNSPHGQQTAVKLTDKIFVIWLFWFLLLILREKLTSGYDVLNLKQFLKVPNSQC